MNHDLGEARVSTVRVVHAEDRVRTLYGAGNEYRWLITGEQSNGQYFAMEAVVPAGAGPPLHIQTREEEAFYVLSGEVVFYADGKRVEGKAGTFVHIPRGVRHRFRNEAGSEARMLIWFGPAGIEEAMDQTAADPDSYVAIGAEHGIQFVDEE